ncbi:natural killer cell receptor 2B4-like [Calonectris borealis]|uniref:natural killer cell receptor 2B4-like n=1 Tax=Calonectris borealis TaxID=1323832 RepID=UPI003F4BED36
MYGEEITPTGWAERCRCGIPLRWRWLCPLASHGASPGAAGPRSPRSALGPPECREQAVSAGGALQLLPEKPPQGWARVEWRVVLGAGHQRRILTAEKNEAAPSSVGPFSGRAVFQRETLSLRISPVSPADSGVYKADFEDTSGAVTALCFRVWVWEPVRQPCLEARILHQEQGRCNLSLLCTVPSADNVSYSWSCSGDPPGAVEHQPWLHPQVHGDADPTVCRCNASNPVSWSTASTDLVAACRAAAPGWWDKWFRGEFLPLQLQNEVWDLNPYGINKWESEGAALPAGAGQAAHSRGRHARP